MRRAIVVLAVVCAVSAQSTSASRTRVPSPAAATAALGRLLHQLYGGFHGYWTCPGPAVDGRIDCIAEVHEGRLWHQVTVSARWRNGVVVFFTTTNRPAQSWVRHWSPYSRHYIVRSHESAPGVLAVNSPAYDWGWLAGLAQRLKDGETRQLGSVDGYTGPGFGRFFTFICSRQSALITCRNALGDAMRYRPDAASK